MIEYKLEHILSYTGALRDAPEVIGPVPEGIRVNFYSTGGESSRGRGFPERSGQVKLDPLLTAADARYRL